MSATIRWKPLAEGKALPVNSPSRFIEVMEQIYGPFPIRIGPDEDLFLSVMIAVDGPDTESLKVLLEAVRKHGEILVEVEW